MPFRFRLSLAALATALALTATPALAQGNGGSTGSTFGVITIDQAKAESGGVTAGDAPGFPVTISQPGGYRLTGNLNVIGWASHGIVITSPGVTLDLNGFELRGPNSCTGGGAYLNCTSQSVNGTRGDGIRVELPAGSPATVAIENGTVRGFGGVGVRAVTASWTYAAHRLRVAHNGSYGVSSPSQLTQSILDRNIAGGVAGALIAIGNTASYNRGAGFRDSGIRHNFSYLNGAADNSNGYIN